MLHDGGHKSDASEGTTSILQGMSTPLVEVRTSPYGGMGLFAKKRFSKDDVVLAEKPFLVVKGSIMTFLWPHNNPLVCCYMMNFLPHARRARLGRRRCSHKHEKRFIESHSKCCKPPQRHRHDLVQNKILKMKNTSTISDEKIFHATNHAKISMHFHSMSDLDSCFPGEAPLSCVSRDILDIFAGVCVWDQAHSSGCLVDKHGRSTNG
jgi:hypothetical protein